MSSYRVAPIFSIRLAGVPFESLQQLATPLTAAAAREFNAAVPIGAKAGGDNARFAQMDRWMDEELGQARAALWSACRRILPRYLVFGTGGVRELQQRLLREPEPGALPARNAKAGDRERHLFLYLQRVCAKNDTLSEFGPTGWGTSGPGVAQFHVVPGVAGRLPYMERWTAHALAAVLNADRTVREEIAPRLNPNGRLEGDRFVLASTGQTLPLGPAAIELLKRCDGKTPAHSLGAELSLIEQLATQDVLRWQVEVPALEPDAFHQLVEEMARWRDTPTRGRWLQLLQPLVRAPGLFAAAPSVEERVRIMDGARAVFNDMGAQSPSSQRTLYAATNPIGEECRRACSFHLPEQMMDDFARDAAPWLDLWRDTYAFVASRVAAGLKQLLSSAAGGPGALRLPAFLNHCETMKMPLTGPGMVVLAHLAFQEVKTAFRAAVSSRPDAPEWELTGDDCALVRREFEFPKFDEYTYPSADLQISASSFAAVAAGDYQWVLSELHPPIAMLHHCFHWNCPQPAQLADAMASTVFGRPNFHFGFFAADFTSHTTVRIFDALPGLTNFVASQRGNPKWRTVAPAETEVFVDENSGDVGLRRLGSHEYLGSFARAWLIPLGFHPFNFGRAPHMPRLRCGRVIVQRRSWVVRHEEFPAGKFVGVSRQLVLAVEQLRAEKNWPRYVYTRPTEQALRRSGAEGRDKDTKPIFIDLESYLSLEIFHRWLVKAGELEVTEMLPDPDHLCWQEADGRRTFELRTLIVPR